MIVKTFNVGVLYANVHWTFFRIDVYHYTSRESRDKILQSELIRPSVVPSGNRGGRDDARHGTGVYGTTLPPSTTTPGEPTLFF